MLSEFRTWYALQPVAIRLLLTINVVAYVAWQFPLRLFGAVNDFVWTHLALNPTLPHLLYEPWQVITYAFLHLGAGLNGLLHILFNMLWLVWIGRDFESNHGPAPLFSTYVLSSAGGALLTVLLHALMPGVPLFGGLVHGASGGVLGVMALVALLHPHQRITLLFIGSLRLLHLVVGFLVLDLLFLSAGGTAVAAHLGGVLTGFLLARVQQRGLDPAAWARPLFAAGRSSGLRSRSRVARSAPAGRGSVLARLEALLGRRSQAEPGGRLGGGRAHSTGRPGQPGSAPRRSLASGRDAEGAGDDATREPLSAEVDRILDKISASGYDSLTDEERRLLLDASGK